MRHFYYFLFLLWMVFLQKIQFCKIICKKVQLFFHYSWKKIFFNVGSVFLIPFILTQLALESKPIYARYYKQTYGYIPSCSTCHKDGGGSVLNPYGEAFKKAGNDVDSFSKLANLDYDGDGFTNEVESKSKANPGDKNSTPKNPGNWLDPNSLVPKDVQNLFPSIRTWVLKDAILTSSDLEESKKMGATLTARDENTIYIPVENQLPVGTSILFPVTYENKTFYLMMSTDKSLVIKEIKVLDAKNLPGAQKSEYYQAYLGKKPKEINISSSKNLESAIAQAIKNAGILLYVRLKGA